MSSAVDAPIIGSRPIDAVLFDFGGVFTPSPFDAVRTLGTVAGIDAEQAMQFVFGSYELDTDHPWHQAERGELDLNSVRDHVRTETRAHGVEIDLYDMLAAMAGTGIRDDMVERVHQLRRDQYRTAMITNNVVEFRELWRPMLPLDDLFDIVIDSSEVGMRKPDPRIFELALEQLGGVDPARAVFLDDYPGNIVAAEAVGLHGVLVTDDYAAAITRLDELLVGDAPTRP